MNFEQLGTGTLHIGFFVLVAAISGAVAWALAASITPIEQAWNRARNRYGEREFGSGDDYAWVTKTAIVWSWARRHSSLIKKLDGVWYEAKDECMGESGEWNEEHIPHFHMTVIKRLFLIIFLRATRRLYSLLKRPLGRRLKREGTRAGVSDAPDQQPSG